MKNRVKKILQKRPRLPRKLPRVSVKRFRRKDLEQSLQQAVQGIPRITNETVAEHREEVLSSARKYIYPLQHSAHRVVIISSSLLVVLLVAFFTYCTLALYKFHSSSIFLYRVAQVIPFPIAKAGSRYVAYENYLFELRHYEHYYQTQQRIDFSSESGKQQLAEFRTRAMQRVVDDAYIKQIADKNNVSVSDRELNDAIQLVRTQNRLGSSNQVFEDVLKEFWGWSVSDFKRELKQQMLAQKVVSTLDVSTHKRAETVDGLLKAGGDFAALAKQFSDDASTKSNGGDYGFAIGQSDRDLPPQVIDALFRMQAGVVSGIIDTGSGLEILLLKDKDAATGKVHAAHIAFNFKPISTYTDPLKQKNKPHYYIGIGQ
ncbi:MAG TPA: peptidylprolyl isomerase [Candidatus Saccharimonadales bacterium]